MKIICLDLVAAFRLPGICEVCGKKVKAAEGHHISACGSGDHRRLDIPINMIRLGQSSTFQCECHTRYHYEHKPPRAEMLAIAAKREGMDVAECQDAIWFLQRQKKMLFECEHVAGWIKVGRDYFVCKDCGDKKI